MAGESSGGTAQLRRDGGNPLASSRSGLGCENEDGAEKRVL